jgi:hypothetical protein
MSRENYEDEEKLIKSVFLKKREKKELICFF